MLEPAENLKSNWGQVTHFTDKEGEVQISPFLMVKSMHLHSSYDFPSEQL